MALRLRISSYGLLAALCCDGAFSATSTDLTGQDVPPIVGKYVDATLIQQKALRGAQMEVDIDASIPKLRKHATFHALQKISRIGSITYKALGFSGDSTVRKEVITRYLAAEAEGRESGAIAITPENYKFKHKGTWESNGRRVEILQLTPRKKMVGLFKGELWVDAETGMPIRESGEFVKSPSLFLKKISFSRFYELRDGIAVPKRIESRVDTRIVGRADLQIVFSNFEQDTSPEDPSASTTEPSQTPAPTEADAKRADTPQANPTQPALIQPVVTQ